MRRLVVLAVLAGLGACSDSEDSGERPPPSSDTSSTAIPTDEWRREQTSWALRAVDDQELTIVVAAGGDPDCERFDGTEVTEDDDGVEVRAYVKVRVPAENEELICEASAVLEPTEVELSQPLASRELRGCRSSRPIEEVLTRSDCADIQDQT